MSSPPGSAMPCTCGGGTVCRRCLRTGSSAGSQRRAAWVHRRTTGSTPRSTSSRRRASGCARCRSVSTPSPASTGCAPRAWRVTRCGGSAPSPPSPSGWSAPAACIPFSTHPPSRAPTRFPTSSARCAGCRRTTRPPRRISTTSPQRCPRSACPTCPRTTSKDVADSSARSTSSSWTTPPALDCSGPAGSPISRAADQRPTPSSG